MDKQQSNISIDFREPLPAGMIEAKYSLIPQTYMIEAYNGYAMKQKEKYNAWEQKLIQSAIRDAEKLNVEKSKPKLINAKSEPQKQQVMPAKQKPIRIKQKQKPATNSKPVSTTQNLFRNQSQNQNDIQSKYILHKITTTTPFHNNWDSSQSNL